MNRSTQRVERLDLASLQPSDRYGWSAVARNVLPFFVLLILSATLAERSRAAAWSIAPLIGLFLYRTTIVMHDCTHGTLFKSARLNHRVGLLLGAMTGIDFHRFRSQHWKHHRSYGQPDDPQGFHYLGVPRMTRLQFAWHVIKPLLGGNVRYVWRESLLAPKNFQRALRRGDAVIFIVMQLAICAIVTDGGKQLSLMLLPAVSAATFGLFFSQIRGLAEHGPLHDHPQAFAVHSHVARVLERIFLYDLHFNYHTAHHRWPQCPSRHLPMVHDRYLSTHSPLEPSMIGTVTTIGAKSLL